MTRVTPIYETHFDLAFPLPKLYWLATPAFGGAIEHWGLITSDSASTLYNGKDGLTKYQVAWLVAHEVAHQW